MIQFQKPDQRGKILVPALLWMAGLPLGAVVIIWLVFFR